MIADLLGKLGVANDPRLSGAGPTRETHAVHSPIDGSLLANVGLDDASTYDATIARSAAAFCRWREVPAPERGLVVRAVGDEFRRLKDPLGRLLSLEVGKILQEGWGEVQETIDIADFSVGLSRQLYGLTMPSERQRHRIIEQWHPLGPVGVISAFNFPNAVWAWNAMVAAVCGDTTVWKPSLFAPLTAIASNAIAARVAEAMGHRDIFTLVIGRDDVVGERLAADHRLPLISATGSCRMGRRVGQVVADRIGRCLLELGGNNAAIIDKSADLALAVPAVVFGAAGTAGQRCTTTRRLIVHESIANDVCERLVRAYRQLRIGNPLAEGTLVGPLISQRSAEAYTRAVTLAKEQGGTVLIGGRVLGGAARNALLSRPTPMAELANLDAGGESTYVEPTIVRAPASNTLAISNEETFAPILYVFTFRDIDEAIAMNNNVAQGLSSAIFTDSVRAAERFLSGAGSDCSIANVNAGTSGAEIGGAFGGEKETGGGRESGSDSWKAYMRRQTCVINHNSTLALAQGIRFD